MRRAAALLALSLALLAPTGALGATPRASLVDIEDEVMCVTCKIPLNIAEGPQPDRQREFIRDLIDQGRTKEQIKAALVAQYGENVLALPERDGVGITAYAVPLALVGILAAGLAVLLPRWRRRAAAAPAQSQPPPALTAADERRLDDDLARY
ncbi:MAG TPA: cytochrome c-type biogenesis protein CcmH [Solirubrobacteraceae bacterium]|jgi:cytochrome c-type biogenesis protein CcmH|nr:cytochrome c-type biogenesis protein CcmH [Solirubrobacteraceae bacterium]